MPTEHDFYSALLEGRWQPEIELEQIKDTYVARYRQGETVVERSSPWSANQAEGDLMEEIRRGALEGEYFPIQN